MTGAGQVGEGAGDVERRGGVSELLEDGDVLGELGAELFKEFLLQRQRAFLGRENVRLVLLEFRSDVAFGVFDRLLADEIGGDFFAVGVGHLDIEAEHLVVADFERGDVGAGDEFGLVVGEEGAGVVREGTETVEVRVVAVADDIAVAEMGGGFVEEGGSGRGW